MNKQEEQYIINRVKQLYKTPQTANTQRPTNAIYLNPTNTLEHELSKMLYCYHLLKHKKKFITEAVNKKTNERHDIVCLNDNKIFEVVNTNDSQKVLDKYTAKGYITLLCENIIKKGLEKYVR